MPPRRADKTPVTSGEPKVLRSRTKKNVLDNSEEFKINIPRRCCPGVLTNQLKDETLMPGKNDIKIMLANEVIRRQFPKKNTLIEEPNGLINKVTSNKIIKKKQLLCRPKILKHNKISEVPEETIQQKRKRRTVTKNNVECDGENCNMKQLEVTKEAAAGEKKKETKKPVRQRQNKTIQNSTSADAKEENEGTNIQQTISNATTKPKPINRKPGKRPGPRTRKKANEEEKEKNNGVETSKNDNIVKEDLVTPRRLSTTGSELSWTKDISSSSTSTCITVSSKDFYRIDNKIPVIKLTNIKLNYKNDGNINKENTKQGMDIVDGVNTTDIQLSSSSLSSSSSDRKSSQDAKLTKEMSTLDKLASKLKNFDLEIMDWIGYTEKNTNGDVLKLKDKLFIDNFLHEERDVIQHCQSINKILSDNGISDQNEQENCDTYNEMNVETNNNVTDNTKEVSVEKCEQNLSDYEPKPTQLEDKAAYNITFNDEDDALSLYAESITDMESPRNLGQRSRENIEEYVPLPTKDVFKRPENVIYKPTKIKKQAPKDPEETSALEIGKCEKSNADSTSMYKENNESASDENIVFYEDRLGEVGKTPKKSVKYESILMRSYQKPKPGIHTVTFKGICLFNLTSNCKNNNCKFPHKLYDKDDVRLRLRNLDDQLFQEEYVFLRNRPSLRRLYGICFVEDCVRRKLTRVLFEMTLDLVTKSNNKEDVLLAVDAVETTLVYLNQIELQGYGDLLTFKVKSNRLLCDVFMDIIAKSQNFSRFKTIFINLTDFMCGLGSTFESGMASHVLERVCILPYNFNLAQALVKVIRNTHFNIFCTPMMKTFEQQLMFSSKELYEELRALKEESLTNLRASNCFNSPLDSNSERMNNQGYSESDIRYSPDTTNMDSFNKPQAEPNYKRTLDTHRITYSKDLPNSISSESDDKHTHRHYNRWKNNGPIHKRHLLNRNIMESRCLARSSPLRPAFKRRSDQAFGSSPSKFPRRSRPTFF